jgi:hypothetical protein
MRYEDFLDRKTHSENNYGFTPIWIPDQMMDFQRNPTTWATEKGRAAIFGDCGTGKSIMSLTFAENVVRKTNGRVLFLTPLAVGRQMVKEGEKFGIEATQSRDGKLNGKIVITNYERLHYFDPKDFIGVVADESGCIKHFGGVRQKGVTDFMRKMPYRLLCTATAAPNDFHELGTSSEALGVMGYMDMLGKFFKNDQGTVDTKRRWARMGASAPKYRFKKHAQEPFWRFVCSWARAFRKPSDLGFDDGQFVLPPLIENQITIENTRPLNGKMFVEEVGNERERREELRLTIKERCQKAAELVSHDKPALIWCHLNTEGDLLEKMIPDAVQVAGKHPDEVKEERLTAFSEGQARVLISKQRIAGWGLNWQHCAHIVEFPGHSYEAHYQGVRRCWRFGQKSPVQNDIVTTPGLASVLKNLQRKSIQADEMFTSLVRFMNEAMVPQPQQKLSEGGLPQWLK